MPPLVAFVLGLVVALAIMVPITRALLRSGERRAREAERRARQSERLAELGSMTGGLAHEIKNPLSTIGLNADLLVEAIADSALPEDERDRLRRRSEALAREVTRLRGILTDFLQFAGRMKLDPQPEDVVHLVGELADFFHPQCDQAGVVLRTDLPSEPVVARIDAGLLKQAILNLMINAVQAMSAGATPGARTGELIVRVRPQEDRVRIQVIDTGPGIPPDAMEEIFHPYVSKKSGGTGLGLPTARRIVEEHGGRLSAVSEPGRGSEFVIEIAAGVGDGG